MGVLVLLSAIAALASLAICAIVLIVISANAAMLLSSGLIVILIVMLHNVGGLAVGYLIGSLLGMSDAKRKAVSIEVGMQNSGLASSLATLHFATYPMATIPGALFSVWHNISGAIIARIYSRTNSQPLPH
jgi:BASS family bile acid:Na+ symporter